MFDKLEDLLRKFEEIMNELSEPSVANNQERFRALMKEQSNLTPIVEAYEQSRFIAARTGADFYDNVLIIIRVFRQEQYF